MQDSRINYVIVGAFVSAMLVALVVVLSVLAGRGGATDTYYTVYDNVTGIKLGTIVQYEGYPIGEVSEVKPTNPQGGGGGKPLMFKVTLKIQRGWQLPEDSVARAVASGLLSAMVVDIRGGTSPKILPPGSELKGVSSSNFFATLSDLSAEFGTLSNESLRPMLNSLNQLIQRFDRATQDQLPAILKNVQSLTGTLAKETPEIAENLRQLTQTLETDVLKPQNRAHIDDALANLDETSRNMAKFTGDLDQTRKAINDAAATVNKVIQQNAGNIDESMRDLRYTLDTAARYVDEIAQNLAETGRNMSEFSRSIRDNPGLLLGGKAAPDDTKAAKKK